MSSSQRTRICKVLADESKAQYVALIDWKANSFDIQLSDGATAWQGTGAYHSEPVLQKTSSRRQSLNDRMAFSRSISPRSYQCRDTPRTFSSFPAPFSYTTGLKPPGNADPSQWMATAYQALCELQPPRSYTYRMKPSQLQAGALRLSWDWQEAPGGSTLTDHVTLFPAGYGGQVLQSMLMYLATSYSELRVGLLVLLH
jgi:hypothetical protein